MICFANAKINLGLNIVEKRTDGYHNLETIFYPIPLEDMIEIELAPEIESDYEIVFSGIPVEGSIDKNLVVKAFNLLKSKYKLPSIRIYLHKIIPSGAGLGGGSSDAAFMLKQLNDFFKLDISIPELEKQAASLGADCAFFIQNKPTYAEGIGEKFTPISLSLKGYYLYLVKPEVFISTAMAFSQIKPRRPEKHLLDIINLPVSEWKDLMVNDFEEGIFVNLPELAKIKEEMYAKGALYAAMSGSGSTIYGIFENREGLINSPENGEYVLSL